MQVEYINPFLSAANLVISQTMGINPEIGQLSVLTPPIKGEEIIIYVGITGKVKGFAAFSLTQSTACDIASKMMGGMPVNGFDEMAKSAIGEMANMICGNATGKFYELGYGMDITPPAIMTGKELHLSSSIKKVLKIPLELTEVGEIDIQIALEKQVSA